LDSVPEAVATITDALSEARRRDAEVAALREGKEHVGGEDPYRKPRDVTGTDEDRFDDDFDESDFDDED
jgi:ribosome-binding factor A